MTPNKCSAFNQSHIGHFFPLTPKSWIPSRTKSFVLRNFQGFCFKELLSPKTSKRFTWGSTHMHPFFSITKNLRSHWFAYFPRAKWDRALFALKRFANLSVSRIFSIQPKILQLSFASFLNEFKRISTAKSQRLLETRDYANNSRPKRINFLWISRSQGFQVI